VSGDVKYNTNWRENKNICCYFCGETRSVKYTVDLRNIYGDRVLTVDACNRCVPMVMVGESK
jgi:hypothetical protein